jgi:hypothetical protein
MYLAGIEHGTIDGIRFTDCTFSGVTETELVEHVGSISFKNVTINPAHRKAGANSRTMDAAAAAATATPTPEKK